MTIKNLSVALCLLAILSFGITGCNNSTSDSPGYWNTTTEPTTTPVVTGVTNAAGGTALIPGEQCRIAGTGFGTTRDGGASSVAFLPNLAGGATLQPLAYVSWSETGIVVICPTLTNGVTYTVVVYRVVGTTTYNSADYSSTTATQITGTNPVGQAPAIASQNPAQGTAGQSVTLTGTNFPTTNGWVSVNGVVVTGAVFTNTTCVFTIPAGTANGAQVYIGGGTNGISAAYALAIGTTPPGQAPTLNAFTTSYNPGATVPVTGTNFVVGATTMAGLTGATFTATSTTAGSFVIPAGITAGTYQITVSTNAGTSTAQTLTVVAAGTPTVTAATTISQAGGVITVTGTNFTGATAVSINTTPATAGTGITVVSATSLTCTVPALAAGSYKVSVTNATGTGQSTTNVLTVTATGTPTFTSVTPASQPIGGTVTLNGTSFTAAPVTLTFGGVAATATFVNATSCTAVIPTGVTTGTAIDVVVTWTAGGAAQTQQYTVSGTTPTTKSWKTQAVIGTNGCTNAMGMIERGPSGSLLGIYLDKSGANLQVYGRQLTSGATAWGAAEAISYTSNANDCNDPFLATDSSGNGMAVWAQSNGASNVIYYARFKASSNSWDSKPTSNTSNQVNVGSDVSSQASGSVSVDSMVNTTVGDYDPRVAFNSDGNAVAVWVVSTGTKKFIGARKYESSAWTSSTKAMYKDSTPATRTCKYPIVSFMNGSKKGVVAWVEDSDGAGNYRVYGNSIDLTSGAFDVGSVLTIDSDLTGFEGVGRTEFAPTSTGGCIVYEKCDAGTSVRIYGNKYTQSTDTWATMARVDGAGEIIGTTADRTFPQVAALANGTFVVAYTTDCTGGKIYAAQGDGTSFGTRNRIDGQTITYGNSYYVNIATNADGHCMAVFNQTTSVVRLFPNLWNGTTWQTLDASTSALDSNAVIKDLPAVEYNSTGNAAAIWTDDNATDKAASNLYY